MADAVVSYAVQKLGDVLVQEAVVRLRIRDEVEWLRNELGYMQSFINDAEAKQSRDHRAQQWISEITNLANDTVDILQDFNMIDEAPKNGGIVDRVKRYACMCIKEANLYTIGKKIKSLKRRVVDLTRKRETYGITVSVCDAGEGPSDGSSVVRVLRRTTSYAEDEHLVGFEDATKTLLKQLVKAEDRRCVISICGMGGSGKTTLARKLYNSVDIQNRFACRAWICVSQEYSIQDLLRAIAKSFKRGSSSKELEKIEKMNEEDLERYLRDFLKSGRYLVVVDDVWSKEAWESLKRAFPDYQNGSRVIITTRKKDVAERVDGRSFVHHIRFLREEESWDLFEKKISHRDGHAHWLSPAMQEMGKEMVGKCGGLPLAIVVLGGLLSNKKQVEEWHKVKEQLWMYMKNDSIEISPLLSLSYDDLSGSLKQCFLYVGIFPEDYVFSAEKLMWLWMAEEFIPQGNTTEDIAEDYLDELINRNLIQVASRFWGRIETCRIHDLLRDLVVEKAIKVNLFDIYDPARVYSNSGAPLRRRYAIHTDIEKFISVGISKTKLRSLVLFETESKWLDSRSLRIITQRFKYLCVLDLENVSFNVDEPMIPDAIEHLIHLKFLGLLRTRFTSLPPSVGNLKSLQILEISSKTNTSSFTMPMEISKLTNLRHLYIHRSDGLLKIDTLTNLRTLKGVQLYQWMHIDTVNLINLRELVLVCNEVSRIDNAFSLNSVSNLKSLTTLILESSTLLPSLEPLASCPQLLKLWVDGPIENLPPFNKLPQSLAVLKLAGSLLFEDPMPTLGKLLNLRSLEMYNAYLGKEITCSNNGFQQLEYLQLYNAPNLENWRCEESAMPVIKSLSIIACPMLNTVPERFKSIPHYEQLDGMKTTVGYRLPFPLGEP